MNLKERLEAVAEGREEALTIMTRQQLQTSARKVLALLAAAKSAVPALEQAQREGGGTGYFSRKADELAAALAAMEAE